MACLGGICFLRIWGLGVVRIVSEKSGCPSNCCPQNFVLPPPPEKGSKWGHTVEISRKSSKLALFPGGGNAILWTKRFYAHLHRKKEASNSKQKTHPNGSLQSLGPIGSLVSSHSLCCHALRTMEICRWNIDSFTRWLLPQFADRKWCSTEPISSRPDPCSVDFGMVNSQILIWILLWIFWWIFSSCFFQGKGPKKSTKNSPANSQTHPHLHSPVCVGSNGGHPQREGTNLGMFVPIWLVLRRCEATNLGVFDLCHFALISPYSNGAVQTRVGLELADQRTQLY